MAAAAIVVIIAFLLLVVTTTYSLVTGSTVEAGVLGRIQVLNISTTATAQPGISIRTLTGTTDQTGRFDLPHAVRNPDDIFGIAVAISHKKQETAWHALDISALGPSYFRWDNERVAGRIYNEADVDGASNYANRPVRIILFLCSQTNGCKPG